MARSMSFLLSIVLASFLFVPPVDLAKRSGRDEIKRITDFKEFKKYLRTHNNVLVVFAKSEKAVSDWKLLGDVALEMRGLASILFIDCGEDKKLCKKLKVSPSGMELKHYHEGEFNKNYDRKHTVKSMVNFLRDPKGDIPWEEELSAQDVVHLENKQALTKILAKEKKPILVMFYAPWCGFCKRLKPDYASAATELKGEAILAGMDVDRQENMQIRVDYNITGFPTLLYFRNGKLNMKYGGENNREGIIKWMKNPTAPKEPEVEVPWSEIESDVVHLTTDSFDSFLSSHPSVLVMFYAPWCGHCKKMKPEYEEAASVLKKDKIEGVLAAVDATKEKELGDKYKVKGFPTVKYFKDGEEAWDFNERTSSSIVEFMKDPKEPPPPPAPEPAWQDVPSEVHHLTDETFKSFLKKKKHTLVMFYAPWCGHCKKAKPEFMAAAEKLKDEPKIAFAALDCTTHTTTCGEHDVTGYPTFKYFNYGKNSMKYTGGREEADFLNFMKDPQNSATSTPPPAPPPTAVWSDSPGHEHLHHLTEQKFDIFMKSHKSVLVMFYAPWCGHCKAMKPAYAEAAAILSEIGAEGVLATVDATQERSLASRFEIKGYPTLKYFENGEFKFDYSKGRKTGDLVAFMKSPSGPAPPEPKWSDKPSKIHHLTKETFSKFVSEKPNVFVMFYAPWCPHCKKAKPDYEAAAEILSKQSDRFLAAVDCTDTGDLCLEQDVKGYPTFKLYRHGEPVVEYEGTRSKDAFVEYMTKLELVEASKKDEL